MINPIVADNKPIKVKFSKDKEYYFCTCGKSSTQPFCDGSHVGTSFTPKSITASKDEDVFYVLASILIIHPFVMVLIQNLLMMI